MFTDPSAGGSGYGGIPFGPPRRRPFRQAGALGSAVPFRQRIAASLAGLGAASAVADPRGVPQAVTAAPMPLQMPPAGVSYPYHRSDQPMVSGQMPHQRPMGLPGVPPGPPQPNWNPLVGTPPFPRPQRNNQRPLPRHMMGQPHPRKPNKLAMALMGGF